jgi:glycine dehydrogenase subunit 1
MDVSNASHYDGATATAEAGIMAYHNYRGKRPKILLSGTVNPHNREVLCSYLCGYENIEIETVGQENALQSSPDDLISLVDEETSLVVVQYPDFFGRIFDLSRLADDVHGKGAMLAVVTNPTALGLLKTPGEFGADMVIGEGQPLGIPLSYGGPYLGFFATKKDYVRKIAGRLVGETVDAKGNRGYVLTLTAREQHIRREKATSNICSNQGLMALAATIYLSLLGKNGLKQVANLCYQKAHYAAKRIGELPGFKVHDKIPFFHEFVVECPIEAKTVNERLLENQILGGYELAKSYPGLEKSLLIAVTEMNTVEEIDYLVNSLAEASHE